MNTVNLARDNLGMSSDDVPVEEKVKNECINQAIKPEYASYPVMSLRDWFAGQALVGLAALSSHPQAPNSAGSAEIAYKLADAMILRREV